MRRSPARSSVLARSAGILAIGLLAATGGAAAEEPPTPPPLVGPDVRDDERDAAVEAARAVVRLALAPRGEVPDPSASDQFGVQVATDGVVLTTNSFLAAVATDRARRDLWIRRADRPWERAVAVARTPWGDLGLVRALAPRVTGTALAPGAVARGDRGLLVRTAPDGRALVDVVQRTGTHFTDPAAGGDRIVSVRKSLGASPSPKALAYRVDWETARGSDAAGAPIVDAKGGLLGLVVAAAGGGAVTLASTPAEYLRLFVHVVETEGAFRPPDLGVRFAPSAAEAAAGTVPKDLAEVRASGRLRGGALVADVAATGPSAEILWPGDVVVEIAGRAVSSTVPESFLPAMAGVVAGERTPIGVWRGGKKATVTVVPRASDSLAR